jgi:hypothetical protein
LKCGAGAPHSKIMAQKSGLNDLGQRLADLGASLEAKLRPHDVHRMGKQGLRMAQIFFADLNDLFTRGVTHEGIRDLVRREVRDTGRFYTSQIDFAALRDLPWFKRYPFCAWKIFTATAFRLSPPRRLAFAIATLAFLYGCIQFVSSASQPQAKGAGIFFWFIAIGLYLLLLLME